MLSSTSLWKCFSDIKRFHFTNIISSNAVFLGNRYFSTSFFRFQGAYLKEIFLFLYISLYFFYNGKHHDSCSAEGGGWNCIRYFKKRNWQNRLYSVHQIQRKPSKIFRKYVSPHFHKISSKHLLHWTIRKRLRNFIPQTALSLFTKSDIKTQTLHFTYPESARRPVFADLRKSWQWAPESLCFSVPAAYWTMRKPKAKS